MSVPKKSLISSRAAVKKAIIATAPAETTESKGTGSLKASGLTALSMRAKKTNLNRSMFKVSLAKAKR